MYAWLWRHLPGPLVARIALTLLLVLLVVIACFGWVFPWVARVLNLDDAVVAFAVLTFPVRDFGRARQDLGCR